MRVHFNVLGSPAKIVEVDDGVNLDEFLSSRDMSIGNDATVLLNGAPSNGYSELRDGDRITIARNVIGG